MNLSLYFSEKCEDDTETMLIEAGKAGNRKAKEYQNKDYWGRLIWLRNACSFAVDNRLIWIDGGFGFGYCADCKWEKLSFIYGDFI